MKLAISSAMFAVMLATPVVFAQDGQYETRQKDQQARINDGTADGQLSPHQAARLDNNRARINGEVARDAAKNGGHLTPGEKATVHHQVNQESRAIARKKNVNPEGPAK